MITQVQKVRVQRGEESLAQLEVLLEVDAQWLNVAVLTQSGLVARMAWDGSNFEFVASPMWPERMDPKLFLGDLQLAFWPEAAFRSALASGWSLSVTGNTRSLHSELDIIASVTYENDSLIHINNRQNGYQVWIEIAGEP